MKSFFLYVLSFSLLVISPLWGQNILVDGDLEGHSASSCTFNPSIVLFNSTYTNITHFGTGGACIMPGQCTWGPPPQSGATKLGPAGGGPINDEQLAFDLNTSIVNGQCYDISFYTEFQSDFGGLPGQVEIGISSVNNAFGTQVAVFPVNILDGGWLFQQASFNAPTNASFMTLRITNTGSTFSWAHIDNFSLATCIVFPVQLAYFRAENNHKEPVSISWKTTSEKNIETFILERSLDGRFFEPMDTIPSQKAAVNGSEYVSIDREAILAEVFYKLRCIDVSGVAHYSEVISLQAEVNQPDILIYPNPASDKVQIRIADTSDISPFDKLDVYDLSGKQVLTMPLEKSMEVNFASVKAGIYLFVIHVNGQTFRKSVALR